MSYKIRDLQVGGYKAKGTEFATKKEACKDLIRFHSLDTNMSAEKKLLKQGEIDRLANQLQDLGGWRIEQT